MEWWGEGRGRGRGRVTGAANVQRGAYICEIYELSSLTYIEALQQTLPQGKRFSSMHRRWKWGRVLWELCPFYLKSKRRYSITILLLITCIWASLTIKKTTIINGNYFRFLENYFNSVFGKIRKKLQAYCMIIPLTVLQLIIKHNCSQCKFFLLQF